jgi:hypothetical protein
VARHVNGLPPGSMDPCRPCSTVPLDDALYLLRTIALRGRRERPLGRFAIRVVAVLAFLKDLIVCAAETVAVVVSDRDAIILR